jgi:5'-nucleotidase
MKIFALILLALLAAPVPQQEPAAATPKLWRILVTNDDGIEGAGLKALVAALDPLGEVIVSAPAANRSGSSRSTEMFSRELKIVQVEIPGADAAWSVDGTPADACAFGLLHLAGGRPFDLVISGINAGANVGAFAYYSGTVGAAMEGPAHGVPGMAVSLDRGGSDAGAARYAADFARAWLTRGATTEIVYSINVPRLADGATPAARAGRVGPAPYLTSGFAFSADGGAVRARLAPLTDLPAADTDTALLAGGNITVTPLRVEWTDAAALRALPEWMPKPAQ